MFFFLDYGYFEHSYWTFVYISNEYKNKLSLLRVFSYCFTLGRMLLIMYDKHLHHVVSESYKWKNLLSIIWVHLFKSNITWETANLTLK